MVSDKNKKEIREILETQNKESIIEIFLGVLDHQVKEKNELSEMVEFFCDEAINNLRKADELLDEIILLESIIEDLLGIEDDEEIDDTECNCGECLVKDICNGLTEETEEKDEDAIVSKNAKPVLVSHLETGNTHAFPSLQIASKKLKVSIGGLSEVANGKRDSIRGYIVTFL